MCNLLCGIDTGDKSIALYESLYHFLNILAKLLHREIIPCAGLGGHKGADTAWVI